MGSSEEPQVKGNFYRHARKDESGELYMNEEDFINAIAPAQEDYVSFAIPWKLESGQLLTALTAQDQTRPVRHTISSRRQEENRQA